MNNFRVGVIDFFGILCPGILSLINLQVLLFAFNIQIIPLWTSISNGKSDTIFAVMLFVICYLLGFVLRLVSPDYIDRLASFLSKFIHPKYYSEKRKLMKMFKNDPLMKNVNSGKERKLQCRRMLIDYCNTVVDQGGSLPKFFWHEENYPYYIGNKYIYKRDLSPGLANIMDDKKYHNKNNYNYLKVLLTSKDSNISTLIFQAEAFVRFMAGSFWALVIGVISGIVLIINNTQTHKDLGLVFASVSFLLALIILLKFKNQRHREVKILLDGMLAIK
jgi:hypothetical protein